MSKIEEHLQNTVIRTMNFKDNLRDNLGHAAMGIGGEAGEIVDLMKKHIYYGKELDLKQLKNEMGDVLFYMQALAHLIGSSIEECLELNTEKLSARYPNGFNLQDSIDKKDTKI